MQLSQPMIEKNDKGETIVNIEAIEEFLNYCESLEVAINKMHEILSAPTLNSSLLDVYDPVLKPSTEEIVKAFLAIKQVLAKVA